MNKNNSLDFLDFQSIGIGQNNRYKKSDVYTPLNNDTIHLWSAQYNDLAVHLPFARDFLSPEEQEKSSEFVKPADAKRYISAWYAALHPRVLIQTPNQCHYLS